ncbi:MAG: riboflavin synthase [Chloroflexota bacterium]
MFTGIVEEVGQVRRVQRAGQGYDLTIAAKVVLGGTKLGDSICVNGTCLTVTHFDHESFTVGLAPETRERTNLVYLRQGTAVNLERSLTPTSRMGGHFVQGHIDGVGTVAQFRPDEDALWVTIQVDPDLMRYIVPKGFITLDGVSLTVVDVYDDSFTVSLIAYTQTEIILPSQKVGYEINVEVDILGKYVEKMLASHLGSTPIETKKQDISWSFLAENGYN